MRRYGFHCSLHLVQLNDPISKMYEYYDNYKKASGDHEAQGRWARQLTWEIARHAVAEEIIVYPLMEKHLGSKGVELADNDRRDHTVCSHLLNMFTLENSYSTSKNSSHT
jgi:hypothetical protein